MTASEDGLCSFVVEAWFEPFDEDERRRIADGYRRPISFSGLRASADEAEADARRAPPWLRAEARPDDWARLVARIVACIVARLW